MSAMAWVSAADPELHPRCQYSQADTKEHGMRFVPTHPDGVMNLCKLVGDTIGNVRASGST